MEELYVESGYIDNGYFTRIISETVIISANSVVSSITAGVIKSGITQIPTI